MDYGIYVLDEYFHVGLTTAIPAADNCQSSHRSPFQQLSKFFMLVPNLFSKL
jgi:hypothetical protein